jgi:excinuclease ABC subunit C
MTHAIAGRARPAGGPRSAAALLPRGPGVYRFRDSRGRVLYIGRAASLRSRVSSYWGSLGDRPRLSRMIPLIAAVQAVSCDSEHEAAWLERNLLERRLPPWNRTRGGQEVPVYLQLDQRPQAPGVKVAYTASPAAGTDYFGPYLGGLRARLTVSALHRVLPLTAVPALPAARQPAATAAAVTAAALVPAQWSRWAEFAQRNAELAARLADPARRTATGQRAAQPGRPEPTGA